MGHTTIPHPAPFKLWGTALLVLVAVLVTVLLASSIASSPVTTEPEFAIDRTDAPAASTPCGLPPAVARADGLDPRTCATPREPGRISGPR